MIKLIIGKKGSGKTKLLIDKVNTAVQNTNGYVVCIEKGMKLTFEIDHAVRLIDADEYAIKGYDAFYGFVSGVLAGNYDIKEIFIDGILKSVRRPVQRTMRAWALCSKSSISKFRRMSPWSLLYRLTRLIFRTAY